MWCFVLLTGLIVLPAGTASASTKLYSLNLATAVPTYDAQPGVTASGQTVTITGELANESSTQQLGSANLFPPSSAFDSNFAAGDAFQLQSVVSATVVGGPALVACTPGSTVPCFLPGPGQAAQTCAYGSFSAPCVQLRNLSLPPGGKVDVTMSVTTPRCEGAPGGSGFAWTAEVKQANDFSGLPGNDIPLDAANSSINTNLDGACSLAFVAQPHDALTATTITDTDWTTSGGPVTVQALSQSGTRLTTFIGSVTMGFASNLGGAALKGDTTEAVSTTNSLASFTQLSITAAGLYQLKATSGTLTSGASASFTISDTLAPCQPGVSCQTTTGTSDGNQSTVQATSTSSNGFLLESVNVNNVQLSCPGYTSADPNTYQSFTTVGASKVIKITIKNPAIPLPSNPSQALKLQQICFGATAEFATASGQQAAPGTLPDGTGGYIGLLPTCSSKTTGPCHNRQQDTWVPDPTRKLGYDLVLILDIPATFIGDPYHC